MSLCLQEYQVPSLDLNPDHNPHGKDGWADSGFESRTPWCK